MLVEGPNQRLSDTDIHALRGSKHGTEIIAALQQGSATYADKTAFSQEKWQQRKSKKYVHIVTARRPTSNLLCQVRQPSPSVSLRIMCAECSAAHVQPGCTKRRSSAVPARSGACTLYMPSFYSVCCVCCTAMPLQI